MHGLGRHGTHREKKLHDFSELCPAQATLIAEGPCEWEQPTRTGATGELFSGGRLECRKLAEGLEQHRCLPVCVGEACHTGPVLKAN